MGPGAKELEAPTLLGPWPHTPIHPRASWRKMCTTHPQSQCAPRRSDRFLGGGRETKRLHDNRKDCLLRHRAT